MISSGTRHDRATSSMLRRELRLRDLVLAQILLVVNSTWVGIAAKLGDSHVVGWLTAMVVFYAPLAAVVIYLNRRFPLEGGLYQWAKFGFGRFAGFWVAWNLWLFTISSLSAFALYAPTQVAYTLGSDAEWLRQSTFVDVGASVVLALAFLATSFRGLGVAKWIHNAGGLIYILAYATLIVLALAGRGRNADTGTYPLALTTPPVSLLNISILAKMGFGALSGFEQVAILAGECRDPGQSIGRSVLLAALPIAGIYVLGTAAILSLVPLDDIDLINPLGQALVIRLKSSGVEYVRPLFMTLLLICGVAGASASFTGASRLPLVLGWDHLLPRWFVELHPKYKTPANAALAVGAAMVVIVFINLTGARLQEAFQLVLNQSFVFYALAYVVMFAIPIFGLRDAMNRPPVWLRAAAALGLLSTVAFIAASVYPIVHVADARAYSMRVVALVIAGTGGGAVLYWVRLATRA
jgi:glutamate:GABA antiporter